MNLYRDENSYPKVNAQRNLDGRTHYVNDSTLRFHKARILKAKSTCNGLLFYIIESCAADPDGHRRIFRHVIFDISGRVISRPDLAHGRKNRAAAERDLWAAMNEIDAKAVSLAAVDREEANSKSEFERAREQINKAQ